VRFRYSEFDGELFRREAARRGLIQFFNQLLLRTNGDVEEALRWMAELRDRGHLPPDFDPDQFRELLASEGLIREGEEGAGLTARGEKQIRQESLALIFSTLARGAEGDHPTRHEGGDGEPMAETRPYAFGDAPSEIDYLTSVKNTVARTGELALTEDDLEVFERHHQTSCATVLLLDISHSMVLYGEDRITPAKQVALALSELILTRYKRDSLDVVLFGDEAMAAWDREAFFMPGVNTVPLGDESRWVAPSIDPAREAAQRIAGRPVNIQAMARWFMDIRSGLQRQPYVLLDA